MLINIIDSFNTLILSYFKLSRNKPPLFNTCTGLLFYNWTLKFQNIHFLYSSILKSGYSNINHSQIFFELFAFYISCNLLFILTVFHLKISHPTYHIVLIKILKIIQFNFHLARIKNKITFYRIAFTCTHSFSSLIRASC